MYEQVEKPKENKSRAIANSVSQKKSIVKQGFGFVDNRPKAIAQRKLQEIAKSSPHAKQADQLQAMAVKKAKNVVQREYDLADNSEENKERMQHFDQVLREVHEILSANDVAYKLQGSMAQAMQGGGVLELPGDLDVLVPSPIFAADFLGASDNFTIAVRAGVVSKVNHNATGIQVDLAQTEDFGMIAAGTEEIDGITVLNLYETLAGLLLRPEKRMKDNVSFISLIVQRGDELNDEDKGSLTARTPFDNWQALYGFALEKAREIIMS